MGSIGNPKMQKQPKKPWVETPLIESVALSETAGCRIFLKLENLQPSGSFKSRAVGNLVRSHATDPSNAGKHLHFFIPSAGNAGLAAATAASALNHPCTVALPMNTKPVMLAKIKQAGASTIPHGANIVESAVRMREVMDELRGKKIEGNGPIVPIELHPFDHERVWEGASTLVDEMAYQLPPLEDEEEEEEETRSPRALPVDAIICSVGGGGLMNGIIMGIERQTSMSGRCHSGYGRDIHVVATETTGAHSLANSVKSGELTTLPGLTSMAMSLSVMKVAAKTFENTINPPPGVKVHSLVLHDSDAARGSLRLADEHQLLVELACGVSVEAAFTSTKGSKSGHANGYTNGHGPKVRSYLSQVIPNFGPKSRVVIVVCGGSNVSLDLASEWRRNLDEGWGSEGC